jgi:ABC-type multidrug transport system fused ATPase/permease subunit
MLLQLQPRLWLEVIGVGSLTILIASMTLTGRPVSEILPVLGLFAAAAFRIIPSVGRILASIQSITFNAPQIESLLPRIKSASIDSSCDASEVQFKEQIKIREVSYQYQGSDSLALDCVTFDIAPGEAIGLVGTSGAGKSTLVDVILGLLKPTQGEITVDGVDISTITRGWQRIIGYVPQSIYLLDDSIRKNVAFGFSDEEVDESALMRSLKAAQLDEFVMGLPDQTDTVIGERGIRLSGGQRQRIGIARALYHDPPILILDEATSALDKETEEGVMSSVQKMLGRKTILIVAHRLSTVAYCSRVLKLEHGRVVWVGHPHELIEQQTTSAEAVLKRS